MTDEASIRRGVKQDALSPCRTAERHRELIRPLSNLRTFERREFNFCWDETRSEGTKGLQQMGAIHKSVGVGLASFPLGALLTVLLVVPGGPAHGQDGAPATQPAAVSADALIGTAVALLGKCQWEEAFAILRPLTARDARAGNLLFESGMATLGATHRAGIGEAERDALLDVSIAAFRAILAADPDQTRIRLELSAPSS